MKKIKSIALGIALSLSTLAVNAQTKKIDVSKSIITWIGKKVVPGGDHTGTINLKDGTLIFKGEKLKGGMFTVDMTSISTTDLTGEYKGKLDGHLKNDDFFSVEKYPTATLVFKKIKTHKNNIYTITADLTIKGKTNPVVFDINVNNDVVTTSFKVDRTKFDIKYGSGSFFDNLGDKAIDNEFELKVNLKM